MKMTSGFCGLGRLELWRQGEGILLQEAGQESHEEESEMAGVLLQEAGQESHEEGSAAESRLVIAESSGEEVMESLAGLESQYAKRGSGFGEIDDDDGSDGTGSESASNNGSRIVTVLVQCIRLEVMHATIWTIYVI